MTFVSTAIVDRYRPETNGINPRTSTLSIFDQDLQAKGAKLMYSLNEFNFDAAHTFLIPRAVGYSAGLINYFFRGKLEISLPDEGVYAVVDHSVENQKDSSGFNKIKLKIKNTTPGLPGTPGAIEPMQGGQLWAVAKFHRNTCYTADLSGEYGAPGQNWETCRTKGAANEPPTAGEEIVVSAPIPVPAGIDNSAQTVSFTFTNKIPINASDLYLQVVYRGPLGEETDAVVVTTKDIAEPYFYGFANTYEQWIYSECSGPTCVPYQPNYPSTDPSYWFMSYRMFFCDSRGIAYDTCKYNDRYNRYMRFSPPQNFDPSNAVASFNATATMPDLVVSRHSRIAVLADTSPLNVYVIYSYPNGTASTEYYTEILEPTINQYDSATNNLIPAPYLQARGVYGNIPDYNLLKSGDAYTAPSTQEDPRYSPDLNPPPDINPLDLLPAAINFSNNPP